MGWWIAVALIAGGLVVLLALNLSTGARQIEHQIDHLYSVGTPQFIRSMGTLLGPSLLGGNEVTPLINGVQIFPAMLDAIRGARETINLETYIYWSGETGRKFADALSERAREGVHVHLLIDWVGAGKMDNALITRMVNAGVVVVQYHPIRWYTLGRLNNRTHRKLLIVDGRIGFTGGVGIADNWQGNAEDPDHWRDSHFRIEGPAVAQMQAVFMDNWMETEASVLHGAEYFPELEVEGSQMAQVFHSSSGGGSESVRLMYLLSIAAATRSIRLGNAYFVPDSLSIDMLVAARQRGVQVEIIVPGRHTDAGVVRQASRSRWAPLLEAGVAIYEYQPTMYHTKVMIVDDCWVSVGSTNFDNRSFRLNDEANLNVLDERFARNQADVFAQDKRHARRITLEEWRGRPWRERVQERLAALARAQL